MDGPTGFPELNVVLREFVDSVRAILAENFCGAYLLGSFALGDADVHSDVDFVIVTQGEVNVAQRGQLQAIHEQIYALEVPWAQHLEGSYIAKDNLRRVDPARSPYLYLDNGASKLTFDNHDNTAVFRWLLRERGLILAGPDPKNLIEPVSPAQLRREIRAAMPKPSPSPLRSWTMRLEAR